MRIEGEDVMSVFVPGSVSDQEGLRRINGVYPIPGRNTFIRIKGLETQIATFPTVFGGAVAADKMIEQLRQQQDPNPEVDPAALLAVAGFTVFLFAVGAANSRRQKGDELRHTLKGMGPEEAAAHIRKRLNRKGLSQEEALKIAAQALGKGTTSLDVAHLIAKERKRGKAGRRLFSSGSTIYTGLPPTTSEDRERWRKDATEAVLRELRYTPEQFADVVTRLVVDNLRNEDSQGDE